MSEQIPPPRDEKGHYLKGFSGFPGGRGRPIENWRVWMRKNTQNGTELHQILLDLARGVPRTVTLKDGRETVIVPTAEVCARVAIHLDEMMHGKAVTQNEQQRAEREAGAMAAVQALSYAELARRASEALGRGIAEEDAELVEPSFSDKVWDSVCVNPGHTLPLEVDEG